MIDLTNYKILKYKYDISCAEDLGSVVWDNMTEEEVRWAVQITLEGINDTSSLDAKKSWDLFFLNDDLRAKIENTLDKYEVEFEIEDFNTNSFR